MKRTWTVLVGLILIWSGQSFADDKIGHVMSVSGTATITRQELTFRAIPQAPLVVKDILATSSNSKLQYRLDDGSIHTLGPNSSVLIDDFQHDEKTDVYSVRVTLLSGTLNSVAGSSSPVHLQTPMGTVIASPGAQVTTQLSHGPDGLTLYVSNVAGIVNVATPSDLVKVPANTTLAINEDGTVRLNVTPPPQDSTVPNLEGDSNLPIEGRIDAPRATEPPAPTPTGAPGGPQPSAPPTAPPVTPPPRPTVAPTATPAPTAIPTATPAPTAIPTATPAPTASPTPPPPPPTEPPISPV